MATVAVAARSTSLALAVCVGLDFVHRLYTSLDPKRNIYIDVPRCLLPKSRKWTYSGCPARFRITNVTAGSIKSSPRARYCSPGI
jgi:hypothetical protein